MKCEVTFRHMKASDAVRRYVEEKAEKFVKLLDETCDCHVVLSVDRHLHCANIELITDGSLRIRGSDRSSDMYASIDAAVERIVRQVKRYRSKIRSHRELSHPGRELPYRVYAASTNDNEEPKTPQIVRQETVIAKVLDVESAVMQLDLLDTDFLVFTNTETQAVNVVYRLPDGQYGLIEAHASG